MADKERKSGLGTSLSGLIRPTTRPEPVESIEPSEQYEATTANESEGQGRGESAPEIRQPRRRTRRKPPEGESRGRKIGLPDDVHDRLWQLARQKRMTVSAVATDILDKNLPRFRIEREG